MSAEHGPSPTPDKLYDFPERDERTLAFLSPDAIELLRNRQHQLVREARKGIVATDTEALNTAQSDAYTQFGALREEYLSDFNIAKDDPEYKDYLKILEESSIDAMTDDQWAIGEYEPTGTTLPDGTMETKIVSGRDKTNANYNKKINAVYDEYTAAVPPVAPETTPPEEDPIDDPDKKKTPEEIKDTVDKDPAVMAARENVQNLRDQLVKLSVKRQGKLFNRKGSKLQEEYDDIQAKYQKALNTLTRIELDAEKTAGTERTEEQERLEAAFRLVKQFRDVQKETVEGLANTKIGRFVKMMTSGSKPWRITKGILLGAAVGGVGAAITAFTLGTAGGAVGAGLAFGVTRATAAARGFASFDNKHGRGMQIVDIEDENNPNASFNVKTLEESGAKEKSRDEAIDLVHQHLMNRLESDTKVEQGKRRKSTFKALGVVAIGATLAEGINLGVDAFTGHINGAHETLVGSDHANAVGVKSPNLVGPEVHTPATVPEKVYSPDALNIKAGEGWYQTFKDMGIPKDEWSNLLSKAGPQLHDIQVNGHPLAYHMPNGQWGIRMTPGANMPKSALDIISQTHDQINGVTTPSAPSTLELPNAGGHIGTGTGLEAPNANVAHIVDTAPAPNVDNLTAPVDHKGIQNIIHKKVIHMSDIEGNPNFNTFSYVGGMTPEMMGQRLGLTPSSWDRLQDYIANEVTREHNPLYDGVFKIQDGYLRFASSNIPPNTMADMLTHIPQNERVGL